jgi:hypothetical protein
VDAHPGFPVGDDADGHVVGVEGFAPGFAAGGFDGAEDSLVAGGVRYPTVGVSHTKPPVTWDDAEMADGLYQVTTGYLCAGFVVEGGRVTMCAPVLRKRLSYWMTLAKRVA